MSRQRDGNTNSKSNSKYNGSSADFADFADIYGPFAGAGLNWGLPGGRAAPMARPPIDRPCSPH
jgi:hypothetical protein